jgi:hypothetical protein
MRHCAHAARDFAQGRRRGAVPLLSPWLDVRLSFSCSLREENVFLNGVKAAPDWEENQKHRAAGKAETRAAKRSGEGRRDRGVTVSGAFLAETAHTKTAPQSTRRYSGQCPAQA